MRIGGMAGDCRDGGIKNRKRIRVICCGLCCAQQVERLRRLSQKPQRTPPEVRVSLEIQHPSLPPTIYWGPVCSIDLLMRTLELFYRL